MLSKLQGILLALNKGLLKESFFPFSIKIAGIISSYLFTFLVSHHFGAEALGIFSLMSTIILFGSYIFKLGLDTAFLRYTAEYEASGNRGAANLIYFKILKVIIPVGTSLTLIIIMTSGYIAESVFHKPYLERYIHYAAFAILPYMVALVNSEGLRGLRKNNKFSFLQNMGVYFFSTILLFIAANYYKGDYNLPVLAYVASIFVITALSFLWWLPEVKPVDKASAGISYKAILNLALPLFWSNAMFIVIGWTDTLMLGMFEQEKAVGIYNVALKISFVVILPLMTINGIVAPHYAGYYSTRNMSGLKTLANQASKIILIMSAPVFILIITFPQIFLGFFGKEFTDGSQILLILCIGQFINALCGTTDVLLQMTGNEKLFRNIIIMATVINVILNYLWIPAYGAQGSAWASLISIILWNFTSIFFIKRRLNINTIYVPFINK